MPVLDGNVERVLCRLAARPAGGRRKSDREVLLRLAASLLDRRRPGDSNQALMELGATVCTPRAPNCPACPLADGCQARARGAAESFPAADRRAPAERVRQLVAVVEEEGKFLLFRRSTAAGQLAGLWEFPAVELGEPLVPEAQLAERFGGHWTLGAEIARLRHAITTRSFAIEVRRAAFRAEGGTVAEGHGRKYAGEGGEAGAEPGWWSREGLVGLPLTGVARKLLVRLDG